MRHLARRAAPAQEDVRVRRRAHRPPRMLSDPRHCVGDEGAGGSRLAILHRSLASVSFGIWQLIERQPDAAPSGGSDSGYIVADDDHVIDRQGIEQLPHPRRLIADMNLHLRRRV